MKKFKVLASCIVNMECQAEDYENAKKIMDKVFDKMESYAGVDIKGFNIEEVVDESEEKEDE